MSFVSMERYNYKSGSSGELFPLLVELDPKAMLIVNLFSGPNPHSVSSLRWFDNLTSLEKYEDEFFDSDDKVQLFRKIGGLCNNTSAQLSELIVPPEGITRAEAKYLEFTMLKAKRGYRDELLNTILDFRKNSLSERKPGVSIGRSFDQDLVMVRIPKSKLGENEENYETMMKIRGPFVKAINELTVSANTIISRILYNPFSNQ